MLEQMTARLDFHANALLLRSQRQQVIASNIANADTPGYVARDFDFAAALKNVSGGTARADVSLTSAGHMHLGTTSAQDPKLAYAVQTQPSQDGNSVDLDRERASFVDNSVRYESTLRFINSNVKTMLSSVGRMALSRSTGIITVTDRPDVLNQIGTYLDAENENITKQVLLNVKVYSVTLTDRDSAGIDWNLVYKAANGNWDFNLANTFQDAANNSVSGQVGILDGSFAGSTAVLKALSEQGRVSVVTSPSVTTLNLQPVPVQVARQTGYLASIQTTNTPDVGSSTSLTPGTVTSGFNMDLLPLVMPNNELLLRYSINISSLIRLRAESSGDNRIQVPEIDNRIFSQNVRMRSGETLVLSGFDQTSEQGTKAGTGSSWNFMLGGGATRDTTRDVIVVLITPIIKS